MKSIIQFFCYLRCVWVVTWRSFYILIRAIFRKAPRAFINKFTRDGALDLLKICRVDFKIHFSPGFKLNPDIPHVFMSNHLSFFDLPFIFASMPGTIRFVAKKELFKIPLFGPALAVGECIPVDREKHQLNQDFFKQAIEKLKSGVSVWIFPEGGRSKTGKLSPFKLGGFRLARETQSNIIPVGIVGTQKVLPFGKLLPRLHQKIEMWIGEPIQISHYLNFTAQKALMEKVEKAIRELIKQ